MPISLVIADDHPFVLKGLELLFSKEPDFDVLAYCANGEQILQTVRQHPPDILVIDLKMPGKDGLAVLRELRRENWAGKTVILTGELSEQEVLEAVRLDVRGVVLKEMPPLLLLQCLRKVRTGERWLERHSFSRALNWMLRRETELQQLAEALTLREIELVRLVARGLDNRQIAHGLFISEGTVKVHLHHIYTKLGVKNRLALAHYAQEKGLL